MDMTAESAKIVEYVRALVAEQKDDVMLSSGQTTHMRMTVNLLTVSLMKAVKDEWDDMVLAAGLLNEAATAHRMMLDDGYQEGSDPLVVVGTPGNKPFICKVDNVEYTSVDFTVGHLTPLSAVYVNKVRAVTAAAREAGVPGPVEIEKLKAALRFYADPKSWQTTGHPQIDADDTPIRHDHGMRAVKALGKEN